MCIISIMDIKEPIIHKFAYIHAIFFIRYLRERMQSISNSIPQSYIKVSFNNSPRTTVTNTQNVQLIKRKVCRLIWSKVRRNKHLSGRNRRTQKRKLRADGFHRSIELDSILCICHVPPHYGIMCHCATAGSLPFSLSNDLTAPAVTLLSRTPRISYVES